MKTCNEKRIKRFLREELTLCDQQSFESHLESCEVCRGRLDESSAESMWWNQATKFLRDEDEDLDSVSQLDALEEIDEPIKRPAVGQFIKLLDASDDPRMLGRFGGYEIAGVVGTGGMSFVLKGFDIALNRYVAIKVLAPHLAASGAARKRFAREAQAAAAVVHDNVVAIHSVAEHNDLPYLVMPYERGQSLQNRIDKNGAFELREILRIGMQAAAGLAAAHAQGLVHRDVKPANILLAENVERVRLTDFGLARAVDDASLTRTGMIAGTPRYMSPEQARGEAVDQRSDLFSLGSVLYTLCTGRPPFRAETSYGLLMRIANDRPRAIQELNPDVPNWLCCLIEKLHQNSPSDRIQSAAEVAALLGQCLAHVQQPTPDSLPSSLSMPNLEPTSAVSQRRRWWLIASLTMFLSAMAIGAVVFSKFPSNEKSDLPPAGPRQSHSDNDSPLPSQREQPAHVPITIESDFLWDGQAGALSDIETEILQLERDLLSDIPELGDDK